MVINYKNTETKNELEQILLLQRANLPQYISTEEKQAQGFVTVHHDLKTLDRMNKIVPHIIATENNQVVGYALCMHPKFAKDIEILKPMFNQISNSILKDLNFIVMGQICIDKSYRKKGVFRKLYKSMMQAIQPNFSIIVTQIDHTNTRSLQAHQAIGFKKLNTYYADGHHWELIYMK